MEKDINKPYLSIIVPFYNEQDNIVSLYKSIAATVADIDFDCEFVFVNDGSKDDTWLKMSELAEQDKRVKAINLLRNYGQTAAMMAAFDHAAGDVYVALDGDGQNDPSDIKRLVEKINEGYDVVSGWRKNRKDAAIKRNLPSKIANWLISNISGIRLNDYGCSLKAYKKEVIEDVRLYGEMHRFIPIYTAWQGGKITEIEVNHHPRKFGESKYGLNRIFKVILDLFLVMFLHRYLTRPIYIFGGFGLGCYFLCLAAFTWALCLKLFSGVSFILTPLPVLVAVLFSTGTLSILMGLLAEMLVRTYHEAQGKTTYQIKTILSQQDTANKGSDTLVDGRLA